VNNLRVGRYMKKVYGTSDDDTARWHRHWIKIGFDALETMLSFSPDTGEFCHGNMPTIADICLIPQIANARRVKLEIEVWPTLARIEAHALTHPAFDAALPKNQPDAE
jgi:maleylacetoacetate isomerase